MKKQIGNILILDDDQSTLDLLHDDFLARSVEVFCCKTELELFMALEHSQHGFDMLILDYSLPNNTIEDSLHKIKKKYPGVPVVVFSGTDALIESAVATIKLGALNFFSKRNSRTELVNFVVGQLE